MYLVFFDSEVTILFTCRHRLHILKGTGCSVLHNKHDVQNNFVLGAWGKVKTQEQEAELLQCLTLKSHLPLVAVVLFDSQLIFDGDPAGPGVRVGGRRPADVETRTVLSVLHLQRHLLRNIGPHCRDRTTHTGTQRDGVQEVNKVQLPVVLQLINQSVGQIKTAEKTCSRYVENIFLQCVEISCTNARTTKQKLWNLIWDWTHVSQRAQTSSASFCSGVCSSVCTFPSWLSSRRQ